MNQLEVVLREANARLEQASVHETHETIDWLAREMGLAYDKAKKSNNLIEFRKICRNSDVHKKIMLDPYSRRAYEKPRGYAGDAIMLDYVYRPGRVELQGSSAHIHSAIINSPNAKSIIWRRDYLANIIRGSYLNNDSSILSVASGHMRELDLITLEKSSSTIFYALDQDDSCFQECLKSYPYFNIVPIVRSIRSLIKGNHLETSFNLIYSAGLFDYLDDDTAVNLIAALMRRVVNGGMLVVGNFTPENHGRGFMDGFMDWSLILRTEDDLVRLAQIATPHSEVRTFKDEPGNVVYIEIFNNP